MSMRVGRQFHFDSSHVLPGHPKCGVLHGHTYRVEVVVEGDETGDMVLDFDDLRRQVHRVIDELDHAHLNEILDMPTVENIARWLRDRLQPSLPQLSTLKVWEGDGKWAELLVGG
jgi:6-pyruvoyltetrahydropterin/6-carboxytetrahydropterin synthase